MRRAAGLLMILAAALAGLAAFQPRSRDAAAQEKPATLPAGAPGGAPMFAPVPGDSFAAQRDSMMREVLRQIAGRENVAAESVFKNIKSMKGVPAGRLVRIMNMGYGRSLGVSCLHCHVQNKWDSEDKPQKQVAREMAEMMRTINTQLLPAIKNLKSEQPIVNCTTCHRGQRKPAQDL